MGGVEQVVRRSNGKYMSTKSRALNVMQLLHRETGHAGEHKTLKKIKVIYDNITRNLVGMFVMQCEQCCEKRKRKETASGVVVKPTLVKEFNERGQVDLMNMESNPNGEFRHILHYVDSLTKFHILCPIKSKTAIDVDRALVSLFLCIVAPFVHLPLQKI